LAEDMDKSLRLMHFLAHPAYIFCFLLRVHARLNCPHTQVSVHVKLLCRNCGVDWKESDSVLYIHNQWSNYEGAWPPWKTERPLETPGLRGYKGVS